MSKNNKAGQRACRQQTQFLGKIVKKLYKLADRIPNICMECRSADMKRTVGILYKKNAYINQDCRTLIEIPKRELEH